MAASPEAAKALNTRGRVMGDVNPAWQSEGTNYSADFTSKPIAQARRRQRPASGGRKNNPQPLHLAHLRRLNNQPVCTVKTIITQTTDQALLANSMVSSMRAHYLLPPPPGFEFRRSTRFGCNTSKRHPAVGIVPTSPETTLETRSPERLLPACEKQTTLMTTSTPYQFVPRRRRISPPVADESYIIAAEFTAGQSDVGRSKPPDKLRARRRRVPTAPPTTLQVAGFDGGAPPDPTRTITGRKKRIIPDMTKLYSGALPGWMTAF